MARTRSKDYEQKKEFIHNQAVELFAERGFANSSLSLLAKRCQSSKAWVYHYYENKEAILFDIFERHTRLLVETVRKVVKNGHKPEEQLKQVLHSYMNIYSTSQAKHLVLLHDINRLQGKQKEIIVNRERKIVELFFVSGFLW